MTRSARIVILAWSLLDVIRQPNTDSSGAGAPEKRAESGGVWRLCDSCDGERFVVDRFKRPQQCAACAGEGRYEVDPYTDQRVSTWLSPGPVRVEHVGCAWCQPSHGEEGRGRWDDLPRGTGVYRAERCEPCDGTGWRTFTAAEIDETATKRSLLDSTAWTMRGDWPALAYALERLRRHDRAAHNRFLNEAALGEVRSELGKRGLAFLEQALPRKIHVPGAVVEAYEVRDRRADAAAKARLRRVVGRVAPRVERDDRIRELHRAGHTSADIAARTNASERTIRRALNERSRHRDVVGVA